MIIKNFEKLATSVVRRHALLIAEEGYKAINTKKAVGTNVFYNPKNQGLEIFGAKFNLQKYRNVICVGFGKAATEAARALKEILGERINNGAVIGLKEEDLGNIKCFKGTHPLPSGQNIEASEKLMEAVSGLSENDLVICIVSGGGSSLFTLPYDLSAGQFGEIFKVLTAKGANIKELNIVRKHLDKVKGGNLARMIYPATCVSLIFSDVPGDDLSVVASGPTFFDNTTIHDAAKIFKKYEILQHLDFLKCNFHETPKEEKYFERVRNILAVSSATALKAMEKYASNLGYKAKIFSKHFEGSAAILGPMAVLINKPGQCLLGAGESTVKIIGAGTGGRNQHMALAALPKISEHQVLLCLASDGHDNTEAAGAIIDQSLLERAKALGLNPKSFLDNNDSFNFFGQTDGLVFTGQTGSNTADFFVCLKM